MLVPAQSAPAPPLCSLRSLSSHYLLLPSHFLPPGGVLPPLRRGDLAIRMGGGPRTFPGGVSKWQWKRMQAKKARQLLKARLARERQLYEMRKRVELRDAVAHLERPWDAGSSAGASAVAPTLLSVAAEDQLRALADRFHRPGGVDLWNDRDGPRVFASPATGAASARFFPRNAFHSIQPYALVGAGVEASAQGVRENAAEDGAHSSIATDREPAVELTERDDGTWEPVDALGDADVSDAGDWTSEDDDDEAAATPESEGMGDAGSWREQRAMVRRNGRSNGAARWESAGAMAAGSGNDAATPESEGMVDAGSWREQRAMVRRNGRSNGAARWGAAGATAASSDNGRGSSGRRTGSKATARSHVRQRGRTGAGSLSESEVTRARSEPKWGTRNRDDTRNGAGRWNAPRKDRVSDGGGFDSESGSARGKEPEPRRGARSKMNGSDSLRGRSKHNYSANANGGEKLFKYLSGDGDPRANSSNGFAEGLEAPKWKPRRMNRARSSNGGRDDDMGGRFRRGDDRVARRLRANAKPINTTSGDDGSSADGERSRNGGRLLWGDEYSLRPTSELRGSWRDTGSHRL
uniref:DEAD-box ATP-dependent RNA helicase 33 n=1 Tax=Zea mays TaxID=4577 RepID=A0A804PJ84_MAIZE